MIKRKESHFVPVIVYIIFLIFLIIFVFFKNSILSKFFKFSERFFAAGIPELSISEKEELSLLRSEKQSLKAQIDNLNKELGLLDEGVKPSFVRMFFKPSQVYGTFFTSKPDYKSVYKDMVVITTGNIAVGVVDEIYDDAMRVERLGYRKSFKAQTVLDETLELNALGAGYYVGSVTKGGKIALGDSVFVPGFPKIIIGTVTEIVESDSTLNNIFVRVPIDISKKEIFYVLE